MQRDRNNEWSFLIGVGLVVLGVWLLGGRVLGPWWEPVRQLAEFLGRVAWPLLVIGIGVLLIVAARRGDLHSPAAGTRLYRSRTDRMLSGVLAGLGQYFGIDATWVRIAYVLIALATGFGPAVIAYIIASIVIPEEPVGSAVSAATGGTPGWPNAPQPPAPVAPEPPAASTPVAPPVAPEPPAAPVSGEPPTEA